MVERVSSSGGVARWTGLNLVRLAMGGGVLSGFRGRLLVGGGGEAVGEGVAKLCTMGEPLCCAARGVERPKVEREEMVAKPAERLVGQVYVIWQ